MLAHILALTVGLLSFALYMSAFFFPEVYRKSDLTWSGIGLFYALVLWVCAGRITGGVLLGQTASVALLGWLGWQTINLRRELAPIALRTPLPNEAKTIAQAAQFKLGELKSRWQQTKLAEQTNRLAGAIAGWTSSLAQPKKQPPPVGSRSRQSKKPTAPVAIEPAAVSEPVTSEPVAELMADAVANEPAIEAAVEPPVNRPARSPGLFGGLRRNAPKTKSPKAKPPKTKSPKIQSPRPTPPPEPSPDLEEFENWEDEETIEPAPTSEAAIEEVVVVVEPEAGTIEAVVVIESEAGAIEEVVIVESEAAAIEEVVVIVEPDDAPSVELIEVEAIEEATPPAEAAIETAIAPADAASLEPADSPNPNDSIEPEPPTPNP